MVLCTCFGLSACAQPSDKELRQELNVLIAEAANEQLGVATYYRVAIDTLEKDGKNQWIATGNVSFSNTDTETVAVLYSATLHYHKDTKSYSVDTVFGEVYYI